MYSKILTAIDNSPFSEACSTAAISLAIAFNGEIIGSHVYAAKMHEKRFRQMESTLPEEYLVDEELERQRVVHDSLIALGMQLISDSYLDVLEQRCLEAEVPFRRSTLEGRNWERLVEDVNSSECDLVVMGARGHGESRTDTIGSVVQRVARRTRTDLLVIKDLEAFRNGVGKSIVVAVDGSQEAFGALQAAIALGKAYDRPVEAVAAYDPYFHYAVFHSMIEVLSEEAARLFRFEEQEQLHEEIIDTGLARLYHAHLEIAQRIGEANGVSIATTLLTGRAADEVLAHVEGTQPWLLLLGRVGVHSKNDMDIGSVSEHLLRFAPCNLLLVSRRFNPPLDIWSESTVRWTEDADAALDPVPQEFQGAVRMLTQRLALEQGHTVVTRSLVMEAMKALRPRQEEMKRMGGAALSVAMETLRSRNETIYLCRGCGHSVRAQRPVACPVCKNKGESFLEVDPEALEVVARSQGGVEVEEAFDGRTLRWARAALARLERISDPNLRGRTKSRVEKEARYRKLPVITLEFVLRQLSQ